MLVDFLKSDNYFSYNIRLANLWGLETAVYFSAIIDIYPKMDNEEDFVSINRDKIKEITTLNKTRQKELDKNLKSLGILDVNNDKIRVNFNSILSIFNAEDVQIKELSEVVKKKRTKVDVIKEELKSNISTTNPELRDAYASWIDAVIAKQGWMSTKSVVLGQQKIDAYCNRCLDTALELLNIASINGYRDIQWAINTYQQDKKNKQISYSSYSVDNVGSGSVKLSEDIF